jgi:phosphatidate phosphatase LPIN
MLDVQGYKSSLEDTKEFSALAKEIFQEESGQDNMNTFIGNDQHGNLWIYASEEAKLYAESQTHTPITPSTPLQRPGPPIKALTQIISEESQQEGRISRAESEPAMPTTPKSQQDEGYSYAKTLRLTSEQLVQFPSVFVSLIIRNL